MSANELIGATVVIPLAEFDKKEKVDKWYPLHRRKNDKQIPSGELHVRISMSKEKKKDKKKVVDKFYIIVMMITCCTSWCGSWTARFVIL